VDESEGFGVVGGVVGTWMLNLHVWAFGSEAAKLLFLGYRRSV
jgi:hypothetical protein